MKQERKCAYCGVSIEDKDPRVKTCSLEHGYLYRTERQRKERPAPSAAGVAETREFGAERGVISLPVTRIKNERELIAHCGIDTTEWEIERLVVNKWEVGAKGPDGNIIVEPLFQVKAWLKRRLARLSAAEEIAAMLADARRKVPRLPALLKRGRSKSSNMLEVSDGEPHLGKHAWAKETGGGNYDLSIAIQRAEASTAALIARTSHHRYDEVVYVLGNDFLHIDGRNGQTTAGTPQDFDTRFPKIFRVGWQLAVRQIDLLRQVARVRVIIVPGNHNVDSIFCMGELLQVYYSRCPHVTVDNEPKSRKFYRFGQVGLMFCHGDKGNRKSFPLVMAVTNRSLWGDTRWNEIHTGDKHQVRLEEQNGVRVRIMPSLTEPDYWHSENLYVGNIPSAEAFMWSADEGLLGTANYWAREAASEDRKAST